MNDGIEDLTGCFIFLLLMLLAILAADIFWG